MPHATPSPDPRHRIELRDANVPLTPELRAAATEKIFRFLRDDTEIVRIHIDLERDPAAARDGEFVAKGQIDFGGPDLLASVASADVGRSLDHLLENFDRQLRRRHMALRLNLPRSKAQNTGGDPTTQVGPGGQVVRPS